LRNHSTEQHTEVQLEENNGLQWPLTAKHAFVDVDVRCADAGEYFLERRVIGGRAEEGMRGQKGAGAHSRYYVELRSLSGFVPALQETGTECTILSAAAEFEDV
jgi:hypothetical protein